MLTLITILVLYHSTDPHSLKMAKAMAEGAQNIPHTNVVLKRIPGFNEKPHKDLASPHELNSYEGIAFGSPVYFGAMSGEMKYFLDQTLDLWKERKLEGIPATVFMTAGSGAGKEAAILNIWSVLASHGMILIPSGSMGMNEIDKTIPQGYSPFGTTALNGIHKDGPSEDELKLATLQGEALARVAHGLKNKNTITLPTVPKPVGNYMPYRITGKYIYINQIALENGQVKFPGVIGESVSIDEAKAATRVSALNILAVLKEALGGDFSRVKQAVQLTGHFNAVDGFKEHSALMNEVSDLMVEVLGNKGKHARAAMGASTLPLNSSNEIQAIFEMK